MVVLLKTASVRVSFIQIMQVRIQNKGKSVWKSRYVGDVSPAPLGHAPYLVGPLVPLRPQLQLYIFAFGEKKSERRIHRILQYGAAAKP